MSLAEGILAGVQGAQASFQDQYTANRQREGLKISREQQNNQNDEADRLTRKDDARQLVANVDGHLASVGAEPASWNKTDGLRLLKDRPDLAYQMLNDSGTEDYKRFVNEDGDMVGADIVRMDENGDGSFTPWMKRRDTGAVVPMTEGRTADPKDPVQKITPEHLEKVMNARYQTAVGDGGLENTNSYLANADKVISNMARKDALALAVTKIQGQDQLTQFRGAVEDIDIEEDGALEALLSIYKSVGGDPDELRARGQKKADEVFAENIELKGGIAEGSLQELLADKGITKEVWESYDPVTKKTVAERLGTSQDLRQQWDKSGGAVGAEVGDLVEQPGKALASVWDSIKTSAPGRFVGLSDIADMPADAPDYDENKRKNDAEIRSQESDITVDRVENLFNPQTTKGTGVIPKGTGAPTPSGPGISPPAFELSAEGVRDAIINSTSTPTEEQKAQVVEVLKANGIDTQAQLEQALKEQRINRQEGLKLAWVLSATNDGSTTQKAAMAQKITNLVERGDQDVGTLQQAQLNSAVAQGQAATRNAQINFNKAQLEASRFDNGQAKIIAEKGAAALLKMHVELDLMDADGNPTANEFEADDEQSRIIARRIPSFIKTIKLAQGPQELAAGMTSLNGMVGLYMQAKAASDPNGIFSGETYKDIFRKEPDGSVDFDGNNIRVSARDKGGKVIEIAYVRGGVLSEAVSVKDLAKDEANVAALLIAAAEANAKAAPQAK
jgi:hypothetical protein